MNFAAGLLISLIIQQANSIELNDEVSGAIDSSCEEVHTLSLDAQYSQAPTVGRAYAVSVLTSGLYYFDIRASGFDSYLVLFDADGAVIGEDDDGYYSTHSRLAVTLERNIEYKLVACALHGGRGEFILAFKSGEPTPLSRDEEIAAIQAEWDGKFTKIVEEFGEGSQPEIETRLLLAQHFFTLSYPKEAEQQLLIALGIVESTDKREPLEVARVLNFISVSRRAQGNLRGAAEACEKALEIREQNLDSNHDDIASSLNNLGLLMSELGEIDKAEQYYGRALDSRKSVHGMMHVETARVQNNLAHLLALQGKYSRARGLYEEALKAWETLLGEFHPMTLNTLNGLAELYSGQGDFNRAQEICERILSNREAQFGKMHPQTATSMANLAIVLTEQARFSEALSLHRQATAIREEVLGPSHPDTAHSLHAFGGLLQEQGNFEEAEEALSRALNIRQRVFGPDAMKTGKTLNSLGILYERKGDWEKASDSYNQALSIHKKVHGDEHPSYATILSNIAHLHLEKGEYGKAEELYLECIRICESVFGLEHPSTAARKNGLARAYSKQRRFDLAEKLMREVLAITQDLLGDHHPDTVTCLNNCAAVLEKLGRLEEALTFRIQAFTSALDHLDLDLPSLSEPDRLQLLEITANPGHMLGCAVAANLQDMGDLFSQYLRWKGSATRIQSFSVQMVQFIEDPRALELKEKIQAVSRKLGYLVFLPLSDRRVGHAEEIQALRQERVNLERGLNQIVGEKIASTDSNWMAIQSSLPDGAVLVDFFVGSHVFAWVLRGQGAPQLKCLGSAESIRKPLSELIQFRIGRGGRRLETNGNDANAKLVNLIWDPLRELIDDAEKVFVCPDGFLCELPFGILQESNSAYLLESIDFTYLSDPTRLAQPREAFDDRKGNILAVGGVDYFQRGQLESESSSTTGQRSRLGTIWSSIPGTRLEVQMLRDNFEKTFNWGKFISVLEGKEATEENVRAGIVGKRYLHFATHGYFEPETLPSLLLDAVERQSKAELGQQIRAIGLLPGLLSGLVFAGVNDDQDPSRDDGYLTAEEVQYLDLQVCDLVVLSACESALGSERSGEGLMSLRRAFSIAGADTVISSLWKVDDQATAQLMKDFYTNLWLKGMGRGEALHEARLRMLRRNRILSGGDARPSTWGAFVLSGDWN